MGCFCIGGPDCCINRRTTAPDWTYRPLVSPTVTVPSSGANQLEVIPPAACWQGHDFEPVLDTKPGPSSRLYCRRCAETRTI